MFKRLMSLSRYPALIVFILAGLFAVGFAFLATNLFQVAHANLAFLREHGWLAVMEGGLRQLFWITVNGTLALICFLGFKLCESDLIRRYWRWVGSVRTGSED